MWIIEALLSAFFAGITAVIAKAGVKNTDSYLLTALRTVVIVILSWVIVWIVGSYQTFSSISPKSLTFLILSGFTTGASWICYFKALQLGDINKVVPIDKSSTILTMIFAIVFLHEPLTIYKVIGMIMIASGTYLMINKQKTTVEKSNHWLIYAVLSAVFAALTAILGKIGIQNVESNLGTAIRTIVVLILAWVIVFALNKQKEIKHIDKRSWIFIIVSGFTTGFSWLFYYRALQTGQASIIVPIDKLSIVVTIVFARVWFKERLSKKALLGLIILVAGTFSLLLS